jgi:hypothetical protein
MIDVTSFFRVSFGVNLAIGYIQRRSNLTFEQTLDTWSSHLSFLLKMMPTFLTLSWYSMMSPPSRIDGGFAVDVLNKIA